MSKTCLTPVNGYDIPALERWLEEKAARTVAYANKQELEDAVFQSRVKSAAIPEQSPPGGPHMGKPTGTGRVL